MAKDDAPYLIAGLGNPGDEHAHTRHNAGFDALDILAKVARVAYWKSECGAAVGHGELPGPSGDAVEVLLAKPQSFMNTSGGPISQLMKKYKIPPSHLIVIHDDLDIEPGSVRVKMGGGLAGHNGLKSIAEKTCTRDWYRVRAGIGRPPGRKSQVDYVLETPRSGEQAEAFEMSVTLAAEAAEFLLRNGLTKTQNEYNRTNAASEQ